MFLRIITICLFALMVSLSTNAQVVTTSVGASQSSMVANSWAANSNYGTNNYMNAYRSYGKSGLVYRSFIEFDVSNIPENAIIVDASLKLVPHSVDNTPSYNYYVERVDGGWSASTITWNNKPGTYSFDAISVNSPNSESTSTHIINVANHVQEMVSNPSGNNGWELRLTNEGISDSYGVMFYSSSYSGSGKSSPVPELSISYVMPISISGESTHCSNGESDGSVVPTITGGSGNYVNYKWLRFSSGNTTIVETGTNIANADITAQSPGLYLLEVEDHLGNSTYKYFLIGECGEVTTVQIYANDLSTSSAYNEDSRMYSYYVYENYNFGGDPYLQAYCKDHWGTPLIQRAVMSYNLDFDNQLSFIQADYGMYSPNGQPHKNVSGGTNQTYISRIVEDWSEMNVTYNNRPHTVATNRVTNPQTPIGSTYRNDVIDVLDFVNYWQVNPSENYGFELALSSHTGINEVRMIYGSSDNTTASDRPRLTLSFTVDSGCPVSSYVQLHKKIDGGYYLAKEGILKFIYNEEYNDLDQNLSYQIFNSQNQEVISSSVLSQTVKFGDNRYSLDFNCLSSNPLNNGVYVLKVTNEKNETWYLRFKVVDNC